MLKPAAPMIKTIMPATIKSSGTIKSFASIQAMAISIEMIKLDTTASGMFMVENKKIKKVYRISDNKNVILLYSKLVEQLSTFN